jgi:ABC-type microcin C transport system duplicated ATPase subunit YejF
MSMAECTPLLSVRNLQISFPSENRMTRVVDDISFQLAPGETLGIVGESGSGESMTGLALLGLVPRPGFVSGGQILFEHQDLTELSHRDLRSLRGSKLAMVFQNPMTSLNPFLPIGLQITELTRLHLGHSRTEAREHAIQMLEAVGRVRENNSGASYSSLAEANIWPGLIQRPASYR